MLRKEIKCEKEVFKFFRRFQRKTYAVYRWFIHITNKLKTTLAVNIIALWVHMHLVTI